MLNSNFIWADLSTYNTASSIQFYSNVFDWEMEDVESYYLAKYRGELQAGIFETPDYLKKIKMPHFWMSYFQVESTEHAVALAKTMGGKIEVDNVQFSNGNIALIRDPQGAGFTIYDGKVLHLPENPSHGSIVETELQISDISNVVPFYSKIFNWRFKKVNDHTYQIKQQQGKSNIKVREIGNDIKGKYEYWVTTIQVDDLTATTKRILENGGSIVAEEFDRNLMTDNSGEAFFYIREV